MFQYLQKNMGKVLQTTNSKETQAFAEVLAKNVSAGDVVVLRGELGAGKTTFVQGLAKGLGISKRIISPTFVIIRTYNNLYHVDLYRLQGERDIEGTGLLEILERKEKVVVIEWPEKMGDLLPKKRWDISLEYVDNNTRKIIVEKIDNK